jgi:nicotinate-nucleotide pyrophosphorylase (carboxylating)
MGGRLGGGVNHRFGLNDMVLIKDNHIAAAGSITGRSHDAERIRQVSGFPLRSETTTLDQVREHCAKDRIMLDNFAFRRCVKPWL